ncbi:MAG: hypothetical protein INR64_06420 [Caulobacteraceae bacterium]|nr:hypothetical protein [Caulobacter sp.]
MGQMLIRNLDDQVIANLKRRAVENRTSAEEEARRALIASAGFDADAWRAETRRFVDSIGPLPPGPTSTELLRADRDRDNLP